MSITSSAGLSTTLPVASASPAPRPTAALPRPTLPSLARATPQPTLLETTPFPALLPAASLPLPDGVVRPPRAGRTPRLNASAIRRLQRVLDRATGKKRVAGLQVAVRLADGQTWLGASGNATYAPARPIRDDTVFAIASVSKTFVAALILRLAEEGRLDLDAPYGRYVDAGPRRGTVTVRQLLSHTSGIYDYFSNPRYQLRISRAWLRPRSQPGLFSREHEWTYDEIMGLVKEGYCRPGACYRYSNTGYVLLGRVAEAVGGAPLHEQLRSRFFEPLGLEDTYYQPAEKPPADAAHGHWPAGSGYTDHTRDASVRPFMAAISVAGAAGAIASTARDLSVWADALYGGAVLSRQSLRQMTDFGVFGTYGLGTDRASFAGHLAYGHRGGLRGFESSMWFFPDSGATIVLLSNQGNWLTDATMTGLVKALLGTRR